MRSLKAILAACCAAMLLILTGCGNGEDLMDQALTMRSQINDAERISFSCGIAADYGDSFYEFDVKCEWDNGVLRWEVIQPDTIAGISGRIVNDKGQFVFDGEYLMFEMLADDLITPASAPWILMRSIQGGYIRSCGADGENILVQIDDNFSGIQYCAHIWLSRENTPVYGEIVWDGRRIMSMEIGDFEIM